MSTRIVESIPCQSKTKAGKPCMNKTKKVINVIFIYFIKTIYVSKSPIFLKQI